MKKKVSDILATSGIFMIAGLGYTFVRVLLKSNDPRIDLILWAPLMLVIIAWAYYKGWKLLLLMPVLVGCMLVYVVAMPRHVASPDIFDKTEPEWLKEFGRHQKTDDVKLDEEKTKQQPPRDDIVEIKKGYTTGEQYLSLPTASRRVMVIGIIEGILISPTFNAPKKDLYWIEQCITGTTDHQIETIITRYADAHPEYWNWNIGLLAHNAMKDVCPH